MRTIIKLEAEWNGAHGSLSGVDYTLPGWAELPEAFAPVWAQYGPFVELTADAEGRITGMTKGEEILPEPAEEPFDPAAELLEAIHILSGGRDDELDRIGSEGA